MGFLSILGAFVILYYILNLVLWLVLDSDIELSWKAKFGKPISALQGKVVWIVGSSSGIGKALALVLAKHDVKLILSSRREQELIRLKEQCLTLSTKLDEKDILVLPMDLLKISSHQEYFNAVVSHFGTLDILVNNAGRSQRAKWEHIDIQVDRDLFELDVFSVLNLSRIAVRYFKSKEIRGHLAVTSSGAGLATVPYSATYCGAKRAINGYFEALKIEEPTLDVTIFCPGPVATDFLQECFTENPNTKYGMSVQKTDKRMTAERCGELFAVALANKTLVSWVGLFPISALIYLTLYFPNARYIILMLLGTKGLQRIREAKN